MKKTTLVSALAFTGSAISLAHLINCNISKKAELGNILSYSAKDFFEWKGCSVYYKREGNTGSPVILLHDLNPMSSAEEWNSIIPELSKNHRVYVLDLLGCGRSDKPNLTYTNFLYVELLLDFIKSVICEKVFIVASAHSTEIALMASAYDNTKFSGFVFINPPSIEKTGKAPDNATRFIMKLLEFPVLGTMLYNIIYNRKNTREILTEDIFYDPYKITDKIVETCYIGSHLKNSNGRFLQASFIGRYLNMTINHALQNLSRPLHIFFSSSLGNRELIARSWKKQNNNIILHNLAHTGLYPHLETPERTATLIEASILRSMKSNFSIH